MADRTIGRGDGLLCWIPDSVPGSTGLPGLAASALCLAAKGTGAGGGADLVITIRLKAEAGGRAKFPPAIGDTLWALGATDGALPATGALATLGGTWKAALCTGLADVKSFLETAVTAPGTL